MNIFIENIKRYKWVITKDALKNFVNEQFSKSFYTTFIGKKFKKLKKKKLVTFFFS